MNAGRIIAALLDRYSERDPSAGGKWACFAELADRTGGANRFCDLFVVGLWASNQRAIAIEVKVSRSDFQREIEDPSKRGKWDPLCTEFYFATPTGLVKPDEIPEGCGLFTVSESEGGRFVVKTAKKARQRPMPTWPIAFAQSIARRCADRPPALPADFELVTGTRVNAEQLRRLALRIHGRDPEARMAAAERQRTYDKRLAETERLQRVNLGAAMRTLERHFACRIESADHLQRLLSSNAQLTPDPYLAGKLRDLADKLSPPADPIAPGSLRIIPGATYG